MASTGKRVHTMDELRGILILYVVLYHLLFDLTVLFGADIPWMFDPWMNSLRDWMTGSLIVISGVACHYSRSNMRRGLKTLAWALALTVVTAVAMPGQLILFGILHFFGSAMVLYALLEPLLRPVPTLVGLVGSGALFAATRDIYYGTVGLGRWQWQVPDFFYNKPLLFPLGFRSQGLASGDYYPILPWIFLFLAGAFLGRWVRAGRFPRWVYQSHFPRLAWIGTHTLEIYLLHQPLIYGVLYLLFKVLP